MGNIVLPMKQNVWIKTFTRSWQAIVQKHVANVVTFILISFQYLKSQFIGFSVYFKFKYKFIYLFI